jgi:hypothetical protein
MTYTLVIKFHRAITLLFRHYYSEHVCYRHYINKNSIQSMVKKGLIQDTIFLSLSDYGIFIDIVSSACVKNEIC